MGKGGKGSKRGGGKGKESYGESFSTLACPLARTATYEFEHFNTQPSYPPFQLLAVPAS